MKIKEGFELRDICGVNIVVAHGLDNINFSKVITLNESAADVWNHLIDREFTITDMANVLTEIYDVSEEKALEDSESLANSWIAEGLVEE